MGAGASAENGAAAAAAAAPSPSGEDGAVYAVLQSADRWAETLQQVRQQSKGREKYLEAADVTELAAAKEEIKRLRALLISTFDANDNGTVDFGEVAHHVSVENGHHVIADLVAASRPAFAAMVSPGVANAADTTFRLGFIADQDQDSREMVDAAGREDGETHARPRPVRGDLFYCTLSEKKKKGTRRSSRRRR